MNTILLINDNESLTILTRKDLRAGYQSRAASLEAILTDLGINQAGEQAAYLEQRDADDRERDAGLTSEINTSGTMVNLADTIRAFVMVLARHPEGFSGDGPRDRSGKIIPAKFKRFTPEENEAGQKWADGPKQGKEWALTGKLSTDCWTGGE
jgi:hypothetical protein